MKPVVMYPVPGKNKGEKATLHPSAFARMGLLGKDNHEGIFILNAIYANMGVNAFYFDLDGITVLDIDNEKKSVTIQFDPPYKAFQIARFIHNHTRMDIGFGVFKLNDKGQKVPNLVLKVSKGVTPYGVAYKMIGQDGVSSRFRLTTHNQVKELMLNEYNAPAWAWHRNTDIGTIADPFTAKKPIDLSFGASWGDVWTKEVITLKDDLSVMDDRTKIILTMIGLVAVGVLFKLYVSPLLGSRKGIDKQG